MATKKPAAPEVQQMPRLFPEAKLPRFVPVRPRFGNPAPPTAEMLDTFLELAETTGYSPGTYLTFAEIESAGSMNPLAHASENGIDRHGNENIVLSSTSSAAGLFQFIEPTWDRVINTYGNEMLRQAGVQPGQPVPPGNNIFHDDNFSDQQVVAILRQHIDRPADDKGQPETTGSDELMALRSNVKLIGLAKSKLADETIAMATEQNIPLSLAVLYQGHLFGNLRLSQAVKNGKGDEPSIDLFARQPDVISGNRHLFYNSEGQPLKVNQSLELLSWMTDERAAQLEQQYYGRVFTEQPSRRHANEGRLYTPQTYHTAKGQELKLTPALAVERVSLSDYAAEWRNQLDDNTPTQAPVTAEKRQEVAAFLQRTGYLKERDSTSELRVHKALDRFRADAGLVRSGTVGEIDPPTLRHIERTEGWLDYYAALQDTQRAAASQPGALNLQEMSRELKTKATTPERKEELRSQLADLKNDLADAGLLSRPTERESYVDEKGRKRHRIVPRDFDAAREGAVDKKLLRAVERAQLERGLAPNGIVDDVTRGLLKQTPSRVQPYMPIPVAEAQLRLSQTEDLNALTPSVSTAALERAAALGHHLHPGDGAGAVAVALRSTIEQGPSTLFSGLGKRADLFSPEASPVFMLQGEVKTADLVPLSPNRISPRRPGLE